MSTSGVDLRDASLAKISDDELRRLGLNGLIAMVRKVDSEKMQIVSEHGNMMKDVNRRLQTHLLEIRGLKEVNQRLQNDNQELRDLCCFLDDDRQKGRKLAREWQRFGRYTASVMKSEVAVYQEKLHELENKQQDLLKENLELKELCLYLDQERMVAQNNRDQGDGSSNDDRPAEENNDQHSEHKQATTNDQTISYIKRLEEKVKMLEKENQLLAQKVERMGAEGNADPSEGTGGQSKPGAVIHAMKVLEVHEQLERSTIEADDTSDDLNDTEKAIVREMCNVVWRKLEEQTPSGPNGPPRQAYVETYKTEV